MHVAHRSIAHPTTHVLPSNADASCWHQVKRTQPKEYKVKYVGAVASVAPTLKSSLTEAQAGAVVAEVVPRVKKFKTAPAKVKLHVSTIGLKIVEEGTASDDEVETVVENGTCHRECGCVTRRYTDTTVHIRLYPPRNV